MPVLEGKWNCAQCNTKGISGLLTSCPNCNDPHNEHLDPSEAWFLPSDAREITDPTELRYADSGPKWNCGHCGQPNLGTATHCRECKKPCDGDDFVSAVTTYVGGVDAQGVLLSTSQQLDTDRVNAVLERSDTLQELESEPVVMPSRTLSSAELPTSGWPQYRSSGTQGSYDKLDVPPAPSGDHGVSRLVAFVALFKTRILVVVLALAVLGLLGVGGNALYTNYIATETVDVKVQSLSWERQVEIEELRTLTQEDWTVPSDGRVLGSRSEVRSYRQVFDHYETRTRQVPERRQTGSHSEQYSCGSKSVSNGNGTYRSETTYCSRTVPDYTTVYRTETYQEPVYRNEPVYDTKYRYQVDRWVTDHYDRSAGQTNPYWPESTARGSKQRVGNVRHQTYATVLVDNQGRTFNKSFGDESIWSKLDTGMMLKGEQTRKGALKEVYWP